MAKLRKVLLFAAVGVLVLSLVAIAQNAPAAGGRAAAGGMGAAPGGAAPGGAARGGAEPDAAARGRGTGGGRGMGGGMGMGQRGAPAGPPAPVPPEVAIPRPTADELTKINADLKRFVETNTSANGALLKKYASLINVPAPRANSAIAPVQTGVRTTERHNGFVETAKTGDFDILFEGDSITDFWQNTGTEVQKKYFGDVKVANFAVGGDTTQGVLWGLQNGEGQGHKPKAVMLMIGTNNAFQGNTGPEIAEGVGAIVLEMRKDFPDAKIMLLAIFPRGANASDTNRIKNEEANKIIAKLDDGKHIFFTNINDKFLNPDGSVIGFGGDNLHPNAQGYEIWASAVANTLKGWAK
jgi:lysophospholipase L1-like esterase